MSSDPVPGAPPARSGLLRRLPFLVVVGVGLLLWRSPLFPQERELVWEVPPGLDATSVEVQLWQDGTLLRREERVGSLAQGEWTQRIALRPGTYRLDVFVRPRSRAEVRHERRDLELHSESRVDLPLLSR